LIIKKGGKLYVKFSNLLNEVMISGNQGPVILQIKQNTFRGCEEKIEIIHIKNNKKAVR